MPLRCAILDDFQNVALSMADWSPIAEAVEVKSFSLHFDSIDLAADALQEFEIICLMRERTPLPRALLERLPKLKLIATTGAANASVDVKFAADRGVMMCGTESAGHPTVELTIGLMIDLARNISFETARMKAGGWQTTIGGDLNGKTLGIIGFGRVGSRVAQIGLVLGMTVIAWSPSLTVEKCEAANVRYANKDELLGKSDFISLHAVLSDRSRGLIGRRELSLMKPSAYLINTSRGPLIDESALISALMGKTIAGAALDVFDVEPLHDNHPLRKLDNALLTPHLGYVTEFNYRRFYGQTVENIRAWLDGQPIRVVRA